MQTLFLCFRIHTAMAVAPVNQCLAKAFSSRRRAWHQCSFPKAAGSDKYCARHSMRCKHGDWDQGASPADANPVVLASQMPERLMRCNSPWRPSRCMPMERLGNDGAPPLKKVKLAADSAQKLDADELQYLSELVARKKPQAAAAEAFAAFCQANLEELAALPNAGRVCHTRLGPMCISEVAVAAYLKHLNRTLAYSTVYGKYADLKVGLRSLGLEALPSWVEPLVAPPPLVTQFFRDEKMNCIATEAAAEEKGSLTRKQVLEYCLDIVSRDMASVDQVTLINAFFLWVEAGRSHRISDLQKLTWGKVGRSSSAAGWVGKNFGDSAFA